MAKSCRIKLCCWPLFTILWFTITFTISFIISAFGLFTFSYAMAITSGHVYYFLPFISDTGALAPESCVFGQMVNIGAVMLGIVMYIRHKQINFFYDNGELSISTVWQSLSIWMAVSACFGLSVVANFQESNSPWIHLAGAMAAFGFGSCYFIIQTRISFGLMNIDAKYVIYKFTLYFRVFLSFWMMPLFLTTIIVGNIAMTKFEGKHLYNWRPEESCCFGLRLTSTFAEWILAIFIMIYIGTFTHEFKSMDFEEVKFTSEIA